jgi:hypothetical protein
MITKDNLCGVLTKCRFVAFITDPLLFFSVKEFVVQQPYPWQSALSGGQEKRTAVHS